MRGLSAVRSTQPRLARLIGCVVLTGALGCAALFREPSPLQRTECQPLPVVWPSPPWERSESLGCQASLGPGGDIASAEHYTLKSINPRGKLLWQVSLRPLECGLPRAVTVSYDGSVILSCRRFLAVFSPTGQLRWRSPEAHSVSRTLSDARNHIYVVLGSELVAYDTDGNRLWGLPLGTEVTSVVVSSLGVDAHGNLLAVPDYYAPHATDPHYAAILDAQWVLETFIVRRDGQLVERRIFKTSEGYPEHLEMGPKSGYRLPTELK